MTIVIPMAGESSRFLKADMGPKYTLPIRPLETLFDVSLRSFEKWFDTANFVIVVKDDFGYEFAEEHMKYLNVKNYKIVNLNILTRGQAESVYLGLKEVVSDDLSDELMIFNIDTIRHNLELPDDEIWDTLFDAFYDENATNEWSFAKTKDDSLDIIQTAEKDKISNWCSTGLYIFRSVWLFVDAYERAIKDDSYNFYIAPLYNKMKGMTNKILVCPKENVDFAGTPGQYHELYEKYNQ